MKQKKVLLLLPILLLTSCGAKAEGGITFDANGGTFSDGLTTKSYHGVSGDKIFSESTTSADLTPNNGELIFKGWYESKEGKGSAINIDALKYPYYVDYTLYAGWAATVTVNFYTGVQSLDYTSVLGYEGKSLDLPEPSVEGKTFYGWFTDATFTTEYTAKVFPDADSTLYAKFEDFPTITLNYPNGEPVSYQAKAGSKITQNFLIPSIEGSTFVGWFKDPTFKEQFFFDYMPGVSTALYPKFVKTVSISFVTNCVAELSPLVGPAGEKIQSKPQVLANPDHSFDGWYTTSTFDTGTEFAFEAFPSDDLILYGKWVHYPVLTFTSADPSINIGNIQPITLAAGTLIGQLPKPSNDLYEFLGWYYDNGGSDVLFDSIFMPKESLTLKAKFMKKRQITIIEVYNGQEISSKTAFLETSHDIITGTFWDSIYTTADNYVNNGLYADQTFAEATKINLPYNPTGDTTIYVKLAKLVTINFFEGDQLKLSIQGGENMVISEKTLAERLKVEGKTIEGFYYDPEFTNNFPVKVFPNATDSSNVTNIYIRYLTN